MKRIFKITLPKWHQHNKCHKKSYKKTLIANNFCTDAKLLSVPMSTRWLFLGIILECGGHNKDVIEIGERQLRAMLQTPVSAIRALDQLQSLQLLSYEILQPLINRSEVKRREEKRREVTTSPKSEQKNIPVVIDATASAPAKPLLPKGNVIVADYCDLWKQRYNARTVVTGKDAGQLNRFAKEVGYGRAVELMHAYFAMPDSWFAKKRHPVGLLLSSLSEISHFNDTGKIMTMTTTKKADEDIHYRQQTLNAQSDMSDKERADMQAYFDPPQDLPKINGAST